MADHEQIRIGIGPIGWANDDMRGWGPEVTGDRIMQEIAESGYEGSEMSYLYPQDPVELAEALAKHGLVLSGAYRWTNFAYPRIQRDEIEATRRHIDFCAKAGAKHALVAEGSGSLHWDAQGSGEWPSSAGARDRVLRFDDDVWRRVARNLSEVGAYAADKGVTLCVHPHAGTAVEQGDEIARLLDLTDAQCVSLCIDTGHSSYAGLDPTALLRRHADRVRYVHLKDVRPRVLERVQREHPSFLEAVKWNVFAAPGSGSLQFERFLAALKEHGYRGWLVVEADQSPAEHPALEVAEHARSYLRELIGQ